MTADNVVPIGRNDPAVRRAIQLATERLVRTHINDFKRFLADELRRCGTDPENGGAA